MTVSTKCKPCLRELKSHTKNESNQSSDGTSDESSEKTIDKNPDIMPHADLYDKYLEPQPNADSPYGFVFSLINIGNNGRQKHLCVYQHLHAKYNRHVQMEYL